MRWLGRFFDGIMVLLNLIASLLLLCSSYSDHIAPSKSIQLSFLRILYPFFLFPVIGFLVYWIIRRKIWLIIPIITIALSWEPVKRYFPINFTQTQPETNTIKLITYNTCNMGRSTGWDPKKGNTVLKFFRELWYWYL